MIENKNRHTDLQGIVNNYCRERSLRPDSVRTYGAVVRLFARDIAVSSTDCLDRIDTDMLLKWKDDVAKRSSPTTYNNYHRHLQVLFRHCVKRGFITRNPLEDVLQFPRATRRRAPCAAGDIVVILNHLAAMDDDGSRLQHTMIRMLYYIGMRRAQLCGLRWSDIDLQQGTILLRREHSKNAREWTIPLDDRLAPAMQELKDRTMKLRQHRFSEHDQIFWIQLFDLRFAGSRLSPNQVTDLLRRLSRKTGTRVSPHRIRHLFATILANQDPIGGHDVSGIPISLVSLKEALGHTDITTTTRYISPRVDSLRRMLTGLETV